MDCRHEQVARLDGYGGQSRYDICLPYHKSFARAHSSCSYPTDTIALLSKHCSELLIHAADVEGLCQGIDEELVGRLGEWLSDQDDQVECTYAGGARCEFVGDHSV